MKKIVLSAAVLAASVFMSASVFAADFNDVSKNHWAYNDIQSAYSAGIMNGMGDGSFGMGQKLTKAQFVSMLSNLFAWEKATGYTSGITDNADTSKWYFTAVETAAQKGVIDKNTAFYPENNITREEMAVMLVKAMGYNELAKEYMNYSVPFGDVYSNKGYINLAYEFGIISGKDANTFDPNGNALREEAAAMMMRCYNKANSKTDFLHGFYAFSSYSQKDMASKMDAVSLGWSKMEYSPEEGVVVNTLPKNGNEWIVPSGYENLIEYLRKNNVKANLNIFMSNADGKVCETVLNSEENRKVAVSAIIDELTMTYNKLGSNPYDGVTIDFENLKGSEVKNNFTLFLNDLNGELDKIGKSLYVAVQPKLKSGAYFDGYDFKAIGKAADKVILMAYDYYPSSISSDVMQSGFTTTPVTPFDEIYYALDAITDPVNGVEDKNKIVLGLSIANVGWNVKNGVITNSRGIVYTYEEIEQLISKGYKVEYSEKYKNPYMKVDEGGSETVIWFENSRSIEDKIKIAKMFGINEVSVWRLGLIPNASSGDMSIWNTIIKN